MTALLFYLLEVIACSALFAGCYWWILRNGRFYHWNRFYILASVALSVAIPLLDIPMSARHIVMPATTDYVAHIMIDPADVTAVQATHAGIPFSWQWTLFLASMSVAFLLFVKETASLARIVRLKHGSERIHTPETDLYCTDDETAPFTFFRTIFWKRGIPVDSGEGRCMLRHELAHVRLGHSWDKALMQLACCLFWMNPFFMLLRRELELVHEFAADHESVSDNNAEELSSLILCTLYPNHYHDFTSRFFQSSIKRRIAMMTNLKKSPMGLLRKLSIVPIILIALYAFSAKTMVPIPGKTSEPNVTEMVQVPSGSNWEAPWVSQNNLEEPVYVVGFSDKIVSANDVVVVNRDLERMIKSGTVSYNDVSQKPQFTNAAGGFREYMAKNMRYPSVALENNIKGNIVVSFVVDQNGNVTDVRSPVKISSLSDELERVVKSSPKWTPGKQNGKEASVQCFAFVTFKINTSEPSGGAKLDTPATKDNAQEEPIFTIVENMPLFNGKVAEEGFREYVSKNTIYPVEAQTKGISGRVFVEFIIDKDGSLIDAKVAKAANPLLDEEALRVINTSPKWTPGKQRGKLVKVKYTFPVTFKLNPDKPGGETTATTSAAKPNNNVEEIVFVIVEDMPLFNGKVAEEGFRDYVGKNTNYPQAAQDKGISGRVFIEFIIDEKGSLTDAKVTHSVDPLLDAEALRVINSSPKWTPGKQKGKLVKVKYTYPVVFKLNQ